MSPDTRRSQHAALWNSFSKHPTERRHEALWNAYQPLVRHVAERFNDKAGGTFEIAALIDAGNVGLLDAIADFNPKAAARFETLCVPMIRSAMARSLTVQRSKEKGHVLRLELADAIGRSSAPKTQPLPEVAAFAALLENLRREQHAR